MAAHATKPVTCSRPNTAAIWKHCAHVWCRSPGGEPLMREDSDGNRQDDSGKQRSAVHDSGFQLVSDDRRAIFGPPRAAGVDQFSVSLDFPDDRHDGFRGYPGLYSHLEDLDPQGCGSGARRYRAQFLHHQRKRERDRGAVADKAREWGVDLCYSAYSARRTGCRDFPAQYTGRDGYSQSPIGPGGRAARQHQLDCELADYARRHPPLF